MWDMVLNFLKAFPRAWHQVDVRKAFLPKLYSFLRSVQLQHPFDSSTLAWQVQQHASCMAICLFPQQ